MPDQNVREIQLGGKQLVFLFMASVVLAVAIFLLGISVGRGVGAPAADPSADATPTGAPAPAEMPPATKTTPDDLSYHDKLQDQAASKAQAQPPDAGRETVGGSRGHRYHVSSRDPAGRSRRPHHPHLRRQSRRHLLLAARPASGWFVQVAAFKSRENADKQVSQLKAKGYSAVVQADPGSLFRVRIGPFQERSEAGQHGRAAAARGEHSRHGGPVAAGDHSSHQPDS